MMRVFRASGRTIDIPRTGNEDTTTSLVDVINCLSDELEALYKMMETPKEQTKIVRCKDCLWYDEKISFCDNCHLPREQTFFLC